MSAVRLNTDRMRFIARSIVSATPKPGDVSEAASHLIDAAHAIDEARASGPDEVWVVQFDYRADNGARLVGPFTTREDAELWLLTLNIGDFECNCAPMAKP